MKYKDVLARIRFATNTTDDLSGTTLQSLFNNQNISQQLKFALDKYAAHTKALEATFYTQCFNTTNVVTPPDDVLRSQSVRFIIIYNKGLRYPIISKNFNNTFGQFYIQNVTGIPGWFLYFDNEIQLYPTNSQNPGTSTLLADINNHDTTVTLATDMNMALRNGCITIGDEKIAYKIKSGTTLSQCTRGVNNTEAVAHTAGDAITENNCIVFYYKKHWSPDIKDDNIISDYYANKEMDVCDEHIEVIADYAAYKLLSKVDPERAEHYKMNFDQWLEEAKYAVQKGRTDISKSDSVREGYWFEADDNAYRALL